MRLTDLNDVITELGFTQAEIDAVCCCDADNVLQPCGPCRFEDHDKCADRLAA